MAEISIEIEDEEYHRVVLNYLKGMLHDLEELDPILRSRSHDADALALYRVIKYMT